MGLYTLVQDWTATGIGTGAVATGNGSALGTAIDNSGGGSFKALFCDISLRLSSLTPGTAPFVEFHFVPLSDDGTTYADYATSARLDSTRIAALPVAAGAATKTLVATMCPLFLGVGKFAWWNGMGASGTPAADLKYRLYALT